MLEVVLVIVMIVLAVVLFVETLEWRRAVKLTANLQNALDFYNLSMPTISSAVSKINETVEMGMIDHKAISETLNHLEMIVDIHHRTLLLDPKILKQNEEEKF